MEASALPPRLPTPPTTTTNQPQNLEKLKQNLLEKGINPTPKILHTLHKKQLQKHNRRITKQTSKLPQPISEPQTQACSEEFYYQTIKSEYKGLTKALNGTEKIVGRPWDRLEKLKLLQLTNENKEYSSDNGKLNTTPLRELGDIIESERDKFKWLLDDDIELQQEWLENESNKWTPPKRRDEWETIKFLIHKLSDSELSVKDWKFSKMMKQSGLQFTEKQMLRIVEGLGGKGQWKHAISVVEWVYNSKDHRHFKSRFVYTKLLAILGRARRPREALKVFNWMRGDIHLYPDMAAYHSVAVTLGQAGLLKELMNVIERMKVKPKKFKDVRRKNWEPMLQPDVVIFNAVLNACVPKRQWKGVSWVFDQLRKSGLKPNGATYGLAMEVMLQSGKYDLVHEYFERMKRSGEALKGLTYRVLVKTFWEEGKVYEAVQAVREMEQRGVVGAACVYYELACCLCYHGKWQEAFLEIEKLITLRQTKPLEVTFTGMILSSLDGGHIDDCLSIFEHCKSYCSPDVGMINAMLKIYGQNDMFLKAKELYEETKGDDPGSEVRKSDGIRPDAYTFSSMLEASAAACQWEYFEYVYKEMALSGYQLDHSKHESLLVKASRAGKWNLLEHAFDTILEAGEIPRMSLFTEMLCQAAIRHDFERAVAIINTMAHAPFQVSKQHWIDLFEENGDRICRDTLKELLDALCNHNLSTEATVRNLFAALQSTCGSCDVKEFPSSATAFHNVSMSRYPADDYSEESDVAGSINIINIPAETASLSPFEDLLVDEVDVREEGTDWEIVSELSDCNNGINGSVSSSTIVDHSNDDLAFDDVDACLDHGKYDGDERLVFDELELEMSASETDEPPESNIPTAYEILESWKELRKQDGIFFPFQLKTGGTL